MIIDLFFILLCVFGYIFILVLLTSWVKKVTLDDALKYWLKIIKECFVQKNDFNSFRIGQDMDFSQKLQEILEKYSKIEFRYTNFQEGFGENFRFFKFECLCDESDKDIVAILVKKCVEETLRRNGLPVFVTGQWQVINKIPVYQFVYAITKKEQEAFQKFLYRKKLLLSEREIRDQELEIELNDNLKEEEKR